MKFTNSKKMNILLNTVLHWEVIYFLNTYT